MLFPRLHGFIIALIKSTKSQAPNSKRISPRSAVAGSLTYHNHFCIALAIRLREGENPKFQSFLSFGIWDSFVIWRLVLDCLPARQGIYPVFPWPHPLPPYNPPITRLDFDCVERWRISRLTLSCILILHVLSSCLHPKRKLKNQLRKNFLRRRWWRRKWLRSRLIRLWKKQPPVRPRSRGPKGLPLKNQLPKKLLRVRRQSPKQKMFHAESQARVTSLKRIRR